MNRISSHYSFCARWLVFTLGLSVVGCAPVQQEPFIQFSVSVEQLRKGTDDALSVINKRNRTRFIEDSAAASLKPDGADAVLNLMLNAAPDGNPFGWSWASETPPLFMESQSFRNGVSALNATLVAYSNLLANLASENLIPQQEFDDLAKDLNANLSSATTSLGQTPSSRGLSIISTAASAAFRQYLENERRGALQEALEENQVSIQSIATLMREALQITATNLRQNYDEESQSMALQLTPDAGGNLVARKTRVTKFISLNEEYITRLSALRTLNESYGALPRAHRELIAATKVSATSLASIRLLYDNGKHLHELYKELTRSEAGSNK